MNKRHVFYVGLVLLAAMVLFGVAMTASAHPNVTLKSSTGAGVGGTLTPYSTKMTCGGCHFNCTDNSYSTDRLTWCSVQKDCSVLGNCPDYESLAMVTTTHSQGYPSNANLVLTAATVSFMNWTVKESEHGAITGFHSQHGRNENYTAAQRTIWAQAGFTSGTGMSGRY